MRLLTLIALLTILTACVADNDTAPAFLEVEGFDLRTTEAQGTATSDIREVWVFQNGNFFGAYDLPARIPLPLSGTLDVELRAGIRANGVSATPDFYDFYAPVIRTVDLVPGMTVSLGTLPLTYRTDAKFALIEGFEPGGSNQFRNPIQGEKTIEPQEEIVRSGRASGRIVLDEDCPQVTIGSATGFSGLTNNEPYVFLEVDFLSTTGGVWGVVGQRGTQTVNSFDPSFVAQGEWTKIYFEMAPSIVGADLENYLLALATGLEEGQTGATIYLDNIKLIHF